MGDRLRSPLILHLHRGSYALPQHDPGTGALMREEPKSYIPLPDMTNLGESHLFEGPADLLWDVIRKVGALAEAWSDLCSFRRGVGLPKSREDK